MTAPARRAKARCGRSPHSPDRSKFPDVARPIAPGATAVTFKGVASWLQTIDRQEQAERDRKSCSMYILTSNLVRLADDGLPLPWYHRAPLGLMSGTPVHVALERPPRDGRPFGDLIISVVDPATWSSVYDIRASKPDEPGVLEKVYEAPQPYNIALSEAVTVGSGARHDVHLIVEPYPRKPGGEADARQRAEEIVEDLKTAGYTARRPTRLHHRPPVHDWMDIGTVDLGWVRVRGWREALAEQGAKASAGTANYDLQSAVISADTERRILRYVFPRKGAVSISVEHSDVPGAMGDIAGALAKADLNILSSLLRRGSGPPYKAEIVLVVEPMAGTPTSQDVMARAREALRGLAPDQRIIVDTSEAVDPASGSVLYPHRPGEIAVRPSHPMQAAIKSVRDSLPEDKRWIFLSRRFDPDDAKSAKIVEGIIDVLASNDCVAVEALPEPGGESIDVKARMWACHAAIVLVTATEDERDLSINLAHEWGFMEGQGKPLLPLVEEDVRLKIIENANLQPLPLTPFSWTDALAKDKSKSIHRQVTNWLSRLPPRM